MSDDKQDVHAPNLSSFSVLNQRVEKYENDYSLESVGMAFDWVVLETTLDLTPDEIEEAIVEGSMDGGLDAVHITDRDVHIFTNTYTSKFENTSKNFPEKSSIR